MALPYPRILADDFDASLAFYTDLLDADAAKVIPGSYAHFEQDGETRLAVLNRSALATVVPMGEPAPSASVSVVLVLRVEALDATMARLAESGVPAVVAPADRPGWNLRSAYVRDPDGNLLELQQY